MIVEETLLHSNEKDVLKIQSSEKSRVRNKRRRKLKNKSKKLNKNESDDMFLKEKKQYPYYKPNKWDSPKLKRVRKKQISRIMKYVV